MVLKNGYPSFLILYCLTFLEHLTQYVSCRLVAMCLSLQLLDSLSHLFKLCHLLIDCLLLDQCLVLLICYLLFRSSSLRTDLEQPHSGTLRLFRCSKAIIKYMERKDWTDVYLRDMAFEALIAAATSGSTEMCRLLSSANFSFLSNIF